MDSEKNMHITVLAKADVSAIRKEQFEGAEHLIVPIIALVEGVVHASNSPIPELALAEAFGQFPLAWNGRPVTLDHPEVNGIKVSASQTPDVFSNEAIGFLFNTRLDGTKLKTEAWINMEKVKASGGDTPKEIARLESGALVEVSTGLFTEIELRQGLFNGKQFKGVWKSVMPDHLAILPEGTVGACSVEDGCGGPRLNQQHSDDSGCACKQVKDNSARPLNSAKGTTGEHTHQFDSDLGSGFTSEADGHSHFFNTAESQTEETDGHLHTFPPEEIKLNSVKSLMSTVYDKFVNVFKINNSSHSNDTPEIREAILSALKAEDNNVSTSIIAVLEDRFIFSKEEEKEDFFSRGFDILKNNDTLLSEDVIQVDPVADFIPVNSTEEQPMTTNPKVDDLIANAASQFEEEDREWLSAFSNEQLGKLASIELKDNAKHDVKKDKNDKNDVNHMEDASDEGEVSANAAKEEAATVEDFIGTAPAEMQEVLSEGIRMHREQKAGLIKGLSRNERCSFSEDDLKGMDLGHLKKLSKLADLPTYEGQAGNVTANAMSNDSEQVPDAPLAFAPNSES